MEDWGSRDGVVPAERGPAVSGAPTLALLRRPGEKPEELAHDARNMAAALELYCHLLEEPGVLAPEYRHYGSELRLVAIACRRLIEKLAAFEWPAAESPFSSQHREPGAVGRVGWDRRRKPARSDSFAAESIGNLAAELATKRDLLAALAGPSIVLSVHVHGGALQVSLTREELTRVLVNLVRNAVEAMPEGGHINLGLDEFHAGGEGGVWLVLTLEDDGPGIAADVLESVFENGYTTNVVTGMRSRRRGLGLSISRAIVEAAGGRIYATKMARGGARFSIELPAGDG